MARQADDQYMKDLKRQNKDMEIISKRMENHVQDMNVKFSSSLKKVEEALQRVKKQEIVQKIV